MPGVFSCVHNLLFSLRQPLLAPLSVSSHYPNPSPAMTLHRYLPLITPPLPSLSLFAPPLSFSCRRLPLLSSPQLLLFSSSGLWLVVLYFPLGGLTGRLDFINANQSAWQDVTQMRVFFLTLPSITTAYAFTHSDARQLAYKRNVSSSFAVPTFSPSLEDSGVSAKSICYWL